MRKGQGWKLLLRTLVLLTPFFAYLALRPPRNPIEVKRASREAGIAKPAITPKPSRILSPQSGHHATSARIAAPVAPPSKTDLAIPTREDLRQEVRQNPHVTPPSLLRLAEQLGRQELQARQSPHAAETFFSELENCIHQADTPQVQALCLGSAQELGERDPERFGTQVAELRQETSPEALRLRDAVERLGGRKE